MGKRFVPFIAALAAGLAFHPIVAGGQEAVPRGEWSEWHVWGVLQHRVAVEANPLTTSKCISHVQVTNNGDAVVFFGITVSKTVNVTGFGSQPTAAQWWDWNLAGRASYTFDVDTCQVTNVVIDVCPAGSTSSNGKCGAAAASALAGKWAYPNGRTFEFRISGSNLQVQPPTGEPLLGTVSGNQGHFVSKMRGSAPSGERVNTGWTGNLSMTVTLEPDGQSIRFTYPSEINYVHDATGERRNEHLPGPMLPDTILNRIQ